MPKILLGIFVSYLIGSIPTAYIFGRLLKGIDIRKFGSGNVGATNAMRILGKGPGILVLFLDILKGLFPVVFLGDMLGAGELLRIILGVSCISGHNWTVFLNFKGGKGVASTFGVLLGLAFKIPGLRIVFILMVLTWFLVFVLSRIVSLASVLSAALLPVYTILFKQSRVLTVSSIILSVFLILRHKSNLKRILSGEEKRLKALS